MTRAGLLLALCALDAELAAIAPERGEPWDRARSLHIDGLLLGRESLRAALLDHLADELGEAA